MKAQPYVLHKNLGHNKKKIDRQKLVLRDAKKGGAAHI